MWYLGEKQCRQRALSTVSTGSVEDGDQGGAGPGWEAPRCPWRTPASLWVRWEPQRRRSRGGR